MPLNQKQSLTIKNNIALASRYNKRLQELVNIMVRETEKEIAKEIAKLFEQSAINDYAQDASPVVLAKKTLSKLKKKVDKLFAKYSLIEAQRFAEQADKSSYNNTVEAMKAMIETVSIPRYGARTTEVLKSITAENALLIKSIPEQYITQVQGAVLRSLTTGRGMQDLIPFLKRQYGVQQRRAHLLAYDQTSKAMQGLTRARLQAAGITKFIWIHSGGSNHPRKLHQFYNGKEFEFDNPPVIDEKTGVRGYPADAINCRCTMKGVIDF